MGPAAVSIEAVTARLAALREQRGGADAADLCDEVRDLVVICTSSRSGSSALTELLRRSPDLLTFSGEVNAHFTIPVLGRGPELLADPTPVAGEGDGLGIVRAEMALDLGQAAPLDEDVGRLADHTAWRLTMQWPHIDIDPAKVRSLTEGSLTEVASRIHDPPGDRTAAFFEALMRRLHEVHPDVRWRRYDARADLPDEPEPCGPHAQTIIEMAPFLLPRGWRPATVSQVRHMPVVVTAPRNAFRLPLLRRVFPNARMRVLHLTRNPAATINGLRDGWLHWGFFTVDVGDRLDTQGVGWPTWWCFDLPPGFQAWTRRPLVDICAFQWRAAHTETLRACAQMGLERFCVRFEELTGTPSVASTAVERLAERIGIDPAPLLRADGPALPKVMSTEEPQHQRWRANAGVLAPALRDDQTLAVASALGYSTDGSDWV